jgi:S-adenosylmethionine synthetase
MQVFTCESVTEGHPDKLADQISDAILDHLLKYDKECRVSIETLISKGICIVSGELHTSAYAPIQEIARDIIRNVGYTDASFGFDYRSAGVLNGIGEQSCDISNAINKDGKYIGAGDSGVVFGYASNETEELMPLPIMLANKMTKALSQKRKDGKLSYLRPDGKVQLSIEYDKKVAKRVSHIIISAQHSSDVPYELLKTDLINEIVKDIVPPKLLDEDTKILINPTGRFVVGGPTADTGLTGRKNIVDTYGGSAPHGGGSFSGKDPTKIDRSGAYMARYIAKNLVASKICDEIVVQLGYCISASEPVSLSIDTKNSSIYSDEEIVDCIKNCFDLSVSGIINKLELLKPIYKELSCYGHFGRDEKVYKWEQIDKIDEIKVYLG